jgi:hypothetical protein
MTIPKNWQPGDPITAAQLNTGNVEASRPRRAISLGSGSSLVNETLGNQSVSAKVPLIRLVVATEDFAIQEEPTDLNGFIDDVPSGLVREVRLNRRSGTHVKDDASKPFRAYDVTAGLTGAFCDMGSDSASASASQSGSESGPATSGKAFCDVFYVMFNQDSKRWEVMAAGGGSGGGKIWFQVLEISHYYWTNRGCEYVKAVVTQVSCESSVAVGDELLVFDPHYCWFNLPIAIMMRVSGTAVLAKRGNFNLTACGVTIPTCFWAVDSLCCLEEEYGA